MEGLKDFSQLPGGSGESREPETQQGSKAKLITKENYKEMLEMMGLSFKDKEKPSHKKFFDLAMERCGVIPGNMDRKVILMSTYQKIFIEYFKLKGPQKNAEFSAIFDNMYRRKEVDFISLPKGKDFFLCLPIVEE